VAVLRKSVHEENYPDANPDVYWQFQSEGIKYIKHRFISNNTDQFELTPI
jgi:hypothetical protein